MKDAYDRFYFIPIGAHFECAGCRYTKVGEWYARHDYTNELQLFTYQKVTVLTQRTNKEK